MSADLLSSGIIFIVAIVFHNIRALDIFIGFPEKFDFQFEGGIIAPSMSSFITFVVAIRALDIFRGFSGGTTFGKDVQEARTELDTWGRVRGFVWIRDHRHLCGLKTMGTVEDAQKEYLVKERKLCEIEFEIMQY